MIVTEAELEMYFDLWRNGVSSEEIKTRMGITQAELRKAEPEFLHYCRSRVLYAGESLAVISHIPLTAERRADFLEHIGAGLGYPEAALIMGIPLVTVIDHWFKIDPAFRAMVELEQRRQAATVMKALYKKAVGHTYLSRSKTRTTGISEKTGNPVDTTSVTVTEKQVEGDFQAQKFFLINRMPDLFSETGGQGTGRDTGRILDFLNEQISEGAAEYESTQRITHEKAE